MRRVSISPRPDWQKRVEALGCNFHSPEEGLYWNESAYYEFDAREIGRIEAATNELHEMFLAACQRVIDNNEFAEFGLTEGQAKAIRETWESEPPSVYGRFDLAYDGNQIKVLEYNANTPTSFLEAAVLQRNWLQETLKDYGQFNALHEKLLSKWKELRTYYPAMLTTSMDTPEDRASAMYMAQIALEAGFSANYIHIRDVGFNQEKKEFRDLQDKRIELLFSLYPWEWLFQDFGDSLSNNLTSTAFVEPAWKLLMSNKGLLAVLWHMYPNHPYLLQTYLHGPGEMTEYVKKPCISREGANIEVHSSICNDSTPGPYESPGATVYQQFFTLPEFEGNFPVIGSWYVTDRGAAGIGIRESQSRIMENASPFVPHGVRR